MAWQRVHLVAGQLCSYLEGVLKLRNALSLFEFCSAGGEVKAPPSVYCLKGVPSHLAPPSWVLAGWGDGGDSKSTSRVKVFSCSWGLWTQVATACLGSRLLLVFGCCSHIASEIVIVKLNVLQNNWGDDLWAKYCAASHLGMIVLRRYIKWWQWIWVKVGKKKPTQPTAMEFVS